MAFCPICYPDIIEDGDGDRYLPGPMITDEETGELVEDEGERTHIPDEGDVCDRHNVYVSGHRDEGGVWGHPSLTRMLELARAEYRRNPESAKLGEALRLSPECLKDSIRTYAQADDDSDEPHEDLHLALIGVCEQETFDEVHSWTSIVCDNPESCFLVYAEDPDAIREEISALLAPALAAIS